MHELMWRSLCLLLFTACHDFDALTRSDALARTDTPPISSCPGNLVINPGFEADTAGWGSFSSVLAQVATGHSGDHAASVCKTPTGGPGEYRVHDDPHTVATPAMSERYHVEAWVKAAIPAGQRIELRFGEFTVVGGDALDASSADTQATSDWQRLSADHVVVATTGSVYLDVRFRVLGASDGACFELDDVCLQETGP